MERNWIKKKKKKKDGHIQVWVTDIYVMKIIQLLKEMTDGVQNVLHCLSSVSVLQLTLFAHELRESHCTNTWLLYLFIHVSNTYIYI